jgi:hypothetical protein
MLLTADVVAASASEAAEIVPAEGLPRASRRCRQGGGGTDIIQLLDKPVRA